MTIRTGLAAAAALALTACGGMQIAESGGETVRAGGGTAETACTTAVNANMPATRNAVISSQPYEAGTLVILRSGDGTNWRCITSGNGVVEELSIV